MVVVGGTPAILPTLKIAMSEGGIGWVAMLADRLDNMVDRSGYGLGWDMRPADVLTRNFWFCTIDDPSTIDTRYRIGFENIMVETDYPHGDGTWPDTQDVIEKYWGHLPPAELRAMCCLNASALDRLPLPATILPELEIPGDLFRVTEALMPELTLRQEVVVLARALWREGWDDYLAGHITVALGDGTLYANPWLLTWEELRPADILRIDLDGVVIEGDWPVPPGIPLHLEAHKVRQDVTWRAHRPALCHGLGRYPRTPPGPRPKPRTRLWVLAASSTSTACEPVNDPAERGAPSKRWAPRRWPCWPGTAPSSSGGSARAARSALASPLSSAASGLCWLGPLAAAAPCLLLPESFTNAMVQSDGEGFVGFWEAAVARRCLADPHLLD